MHMHNRICLRFQVNKTFLKGLEIKSIEYNLKQKCPTSSIDALNIIIS